MTSAGHGASALSTLRLPAMPTNDKAASKTADWREAALSRIADALPAAARAAAAALARELAC